MSRQQEQQWNDSSPARHATPVDDKALKHPYKSFHQASAFNSSWSATSVGIKALKHPYKNFHQAPAFNSSWSTTAVDNNALQHPDKSFLQAPAFNASWSPATEFSELVAESRAHQLQKEIDPRGHLLAVLDLIDVQWPDEKTASVATKKRSSRLVKSGAVKNLDVQGVFDARTAGRKPPQLKSSTMRSTNSLPPQSFAGAFSSLRRPSEPSRSASVGACSGDPRMLRMSPVGLPTPSSAPLDISSASLSPARSFSEPGRVLRGWSDTARTPPPPATALLPSGGGVRVCWKAERTFTSEFFPERTHPPVGRGR